VVGVLVTCLRSPVVQFHPSLRHRVYCNNLDNLTVLTVWASNLSSSSACYHKPYYLPYGLLPEGGVDGPFGRTAKIATDHRSPVASSSKYPFVGSWKLPILYTLLKTNARYHRT